MDLFPSMHHVTNLSQSEHWPVPPHYREFRIQSPIPLIPSPTSLSFQQPLPNLYLGSDTPKTKGRSQRQPQQFSMARRGEIVHGSSNFKMDAFAWERDREREFQARVFRSILSYRSSNTSPGSSRTFPIPPEKYNEIVRLVRRDRRWCLSNRRIPCTIAVVLCPQEGSEVAPHRTRPPTTQRDFYSRPRCSPSH
jgi:hypothetical protein